MELKRRPKSDSLINSDCPDSGYVWVEALEGDLGALNKLLVFAPNFKLLFHIGFNLQVGDLTRELTELRIQVSGGCCVVHTCYTSMPPTVSSPHERHPE
jgi:hypothetical protein